MSQTFQKDKLRELMLYVASKCQDDPRYGATKLNKILFFSDFITYSRTGKSITGSTYQRLEFGPAPRELMPTQESLVAELSAVVQVRNAHGYPQKRLIPMRDPDLSIFGGQEIAVIDEVMENLSDYDGSQVSELSHKFPGWQLAKMKEEIPYESVYIAHDQHLAPGDVARGHELAIEHGWIREK